MNLTPLHNGRPGIRMLIHIQAREPGRNELEKARPQLSADDAPHLHETRPDPDPLSKEEGGTKSVPGHRDICAGRCGSGESSENEEVGGEASPLIRDNSCPPTPAASDSCLDFISSTGTLDRYHEVIDPAGWRLDAYRQNPVFQNAHNYGDILFTLGKALITEVRSYPLQLDGKVAGAGGNSSRSAVNSKPANCLYQRIQFATDVNPIARIAFGLYKGGFLNAVSVGFIPMRWEDGDTGSHAHSAGVAHSDSAVFGFPSTSEASAARGGGASGKRRRKYLEQELLEVSAVAIPANPEALALAVKSGAVTKADLVETLDLLRSLTVDYGPWRRPEPVASMSGDLHSRLSTLRVHLIFARELRRILRRA